MLVRDSRLRHFQGAPYEIGSRSDFERLLARFVSAWQYMSVNTIQSYQKISVKSRAGGRASPADRALLVRRTTIRSSPRWLRRSVTATRCPSSMRGGWPRNGRRRS